MTTLLRHRWPVLGAILLPVLAFSASAWAAQGTAVDVDPDAHARGSGGERTLVVGADISVGETVITGPQGVVQLLFDDQTRIVVGPGSALTIESYLLAGPGSASKFAVDALGGTFRFLSGNSQKSAYSINSPTATIAIRGTKFDFDVDRNQTRVMLYEGAVQLCARAGPCTELVDRCDIGVAASGSAVRFGPRDAERVPISLRFRYARFQQPLLPDFRVSGTVRCTEPVTEAGVPETVGTGGGAVIVQAPGGPPAPPPPAPPPPVRGRQ